MPCARLPEQVHSALLPVNADAGAAAWLPLVRAAVRRTQKRLFILLSGASSVSNGWNADVHVMAGPDPTDPLDGAAARGLPLVCNQLLRRHIPTGMPQNLKPLHRTSRRPGGVGAALRGAAAAGGDGVGGLCDRGQAAAGPGAAFPHSGLGRPGSGYAHSGAAQSLAAQPLSAP